MKHVSWIRLSVLFAFLLVFAPPLHGSPMRSPAQVLKRITPRILSPVKPGAAEKSVMRKLGKPARVETQRGRSTYIYRMDPEHAECRVQFKGGKVSRVAVRFWGEVKGAPSLLDLKNDGLVTYERIKAARGAAPDKRASDTDFHAHGREFSLKWKKERIALVFLDGGGGPTLVGYDLWGRE